MGPWLKGTDWLSHPALEMPEKFELLLQNLPQLFYGNTVESV